MTEHKVQPTNGPIGRAWLFDHCAVCGKTVTRIGPAGRLGRWRHLP